MNAKAKLWFEQTNLDEELRKELYSYNEEQLNDAFYTDISFGTGGMRGVIGAGTNRMNIYTLRRANYGYGKCLLDHYDNPSCVIAYDPRHKSLDFAKDSASVLASMGIKVYLFDKITPTPELSFAVRYLRASGGIVVTASHNPPMYNGYKIYDECGCQYVPDKVEEVINNINNAPSCFDILPRDFNELLNEGKITYVGKEIDEAFLEKVLSIRVHKDLGHDLKVTFTPLHGTSAYLGNILLGKLGYDYQCVNEQMVADPNFTTVKSPNPENKEAFELAVEYAKRHSSDIIIATDPDADRLGVAVLHNKEYVYLTGNETGGILVEYLCKERPLKNGVLFNTIVTSPIGEVIAAKYGISTVSTLTGFKYIGEQAKLLEGTDRQFFFGYEESYGYVVADFVRDKDSLQAITLICEVAEYYKEQGKTLVDALNDIYEAYGYFKASLVNIGLAGEEGAKRINRILDYFRYNEIEGFDIVKKEDYELHIRHFYDGRSDETLTLPTSNVIKFFLSDGSWFVLRPSGTEPKMKVYINGCSNSLSEVESRIKEIQDKVLAIVDGVE